MEALRIVLWVSHAFCIESVISFVSMPVMVSRMILSCKRRSEPARGLRILENSIHLSLIENIDPMCLMCFVSSYSNTLCNFEVGISLLISLCGLSASHLQNTFIFFDCCFAFAVQNAVNKLINFVILNKSARWGLETYLIKMPCLMLLKLSLLFQRSTN